MRSLAPLALVFWCALGSPAQASLITYTHTGSGSGFIDGVAFGSLAPVNFTITATGDTANLQACGASCLYIDNDTASIEIDSVGTFAFTVGTRYFYSSDVGLVGFSRAGAFGLDLFDGPDVPSWNMQTSLGPVTGTGGLMQWMGTDITTTGGILQFNSGASDSTFTAVVDTNTPVPEPASLTLLGVGLVGMAGRRWRQRKAS